MANPKHKLSRSRTRKRRAHDSIKDISIMECPNCKSPKRPHRVCGSCGYYNGKNVIVTEEEK
ncbi:MAG: 50S ribosomal protein L32 [Vulcanimicrobiota bacterium]